MFFVLNVYLNSNILYVLTRFLDKLHRGKIYIRKGFTYIGGLTDQLNNIYDKGDKQNHKADHMSTDKEFFLLKLGVPQVFWHVCKMKALGNEVSY